MLWDKAKLVQIHWQMSPHIFLAKLINSPFVIDNWILSCLQCIIFPVWFNFNFSPKMTKQIKEFEVGMCSWMCGGGEAFLPSMQW